MRVVELILFDKMCLAKLPERATFCHGVTSKKFKFLLEIWVSVV